MTRHHLFFARLACALSIVVILFSFAGTLPVQAQEPAPPCPKGDDGQCIPPSDSDLTAESTATLKLFTKVTQKGWYGADGVGMSNLGYGTVHTPYMAPGSAVTKAYLYWAILGPPSKPGFVYNRGYINGHAVYGTLLGSAEPDSSYPHAPQDIKAYSYRADVTAYVNKTSLGANALSNFASGRTDGADRWLYGPSYPLVDGASLVVLYKNASFPTSTVTIYNGASPLRSTDTVHLSFAGVNATYPSGLAYTTFIGAEGENYYGASSRFFENDLPSVIWNGSDPNGNNVNYYWGNVWDTMTVELTYMVNAPENDFWFSTHKDDFTPIWVAQVLAYSSGSQDTDGDSLPDGWELHGFDPNRDGYVEVPLPDYGASMWHKDLFVEADYMVDPDGNKYLPAISQLNDIVTVFNQAPVKNPDGTTGIHIHIDTGGADRTTPPETYANFNYYGGNQVPHTHNLGADTPGCSTYDWTAFQTYKDYNFYSARKPIFHYMIFADRLAPCFGTSSGMSRNGATDALFIKGAMDFIVSLGGWGGHGSDTDREGTFIHELGHNLGLRHGGNNHDNYKPNYLSVMNYLYQTMGVYRNGNVGHYDYSRFLLPSLNETSLYEIKGLQMPAAELVNGYATWWRCPSGAMNAAIANSALDWNCDGYIQVPPVKVDVNWPVTYPDGVTPYPHYYTALGSQNNWASITFKGNGMVGNALVLGELAAQGPLTTKWVDELKEENVPPAPSEPMR